MRISNSTPFCLPSGVCNNDLTRAIAYINGLDVDTCNIWEQPGYRIEMSPFGGVEAMKFFPNMKTCSLPWPG